jgi:hypothetical protein
LPRAALGKGFAESLRGFAESLGPSAEQPAPVVIGTVLIKYYSPTLWSFSRGRASASYASAAANTRRTIRAFN